MEFAEVTTMWWALAGAVVVFSIWVLNWWAHREHGRMTPEARRVENEEADHELQTW
jgi:hypothetical protein